MCQLQIDMTIENELPLLLWEVLESNQYISCVCLRERGRETLLILHFILTVHPTVRLLVLDSINRTLSGVPVTDSDAAK